MSHTADLVKAFAPKRPAREVGTLEVTRSELVDPKDLQGPIRQLPPETVQAKYCWRVDIGQDTYWISQGQDEQLRRACASAREDESPGAVVGTIAKVSIDGNTLHHGPVDLHAKAWERIQSSVTLNRG